MQQAEAFFYLADLIYQIRNFIIGLHLVFLGFITFFILAFLIIQKELLIKRKSKATLFLIASGFIPSEISIFLQGISSWIKLEMVPYYS